MSDAPPKAPSDQQSGRTDDAELHGLARVTAWAKTWQPVFWMLVVGGGAAWGLFELVASVEGVGEVIERNEAQLIDKIDAQGKLLGERIDAQGKLLGERIGAQGELLTEKLEGQGRLLTEKIDHVEDGIDDVEQRLERVETRLLATDGNSESSPKVMPTSAESPVET